LPALQTLQGLHELYGLGAELKVDPAKHGAQTASLKILQSCLNVPSGQGSGLHVEQEEPTKELNLPGLQ